MSRRSTRSTRKHVEDALARPPRPHSTQEVDAIAFSKANDTRRARDLLQSRMDSCCESIIPESESEAEHSSLHSGTGVDADERSSLRSWDLTPEILGYDPREVENASDAKTTSVVLAEASPQTPAPAVRSDSSGPGPERPNLTIVTDMLPSNESNLSAEAIRTATDMLHVHFPEGRSDEITEVPRTPMTEPRPNRSPASERSDHSLPSSRPSGRRKSQKSHPVLGHWSDAFVARPVEVPRQIRSEQSHKSPRRSSVSSKGSHRSKRSSSSLHEPPHWSHSFANFVPVPSQHKLIHYSPIDAAPPVLPEFRPLSPDVQLSRGLEHLLVDDRRTLLPSIRCLSPIDPAQIVGESPDEVIIEPPSSDEEEPAEQVQAPVELDPLDLPAVIAIPAGKPVATRSAGEPSSPVGDNGTGLPVAGSIHNQSSLDMPATVRPASIHANATVEPSPVVPETDRLLTDGAQPSPPSPPRHPHGLQRLKDLLGRRAGHETSEKPRSVPVSFGWAISRNAVAPTRGEDLTLPEGGYEILVPDTKSESGTLATTSTGVACCPPWMC